MTTPEHRALLAAATDEIASLHRLFVDWFTGTMANEPSVFDANFLARFDPHFVIIPPAGRELSLEDIAASIRSAHGTNVDFRIQIRNVRIRVTTDDLALITYEEWQKNAKASTPPNNARVGTVLFRRDADGLRWLHLQETALPPELIRADPFDFDR